MKRRDFLKRFAALVSLPVAAPAVFERAKPARLTDEHFREASYSGKKFLLREKPGSMDLVVPLHRKPMLVTKRYYRYRMTSHSDPPIVTRAIEESDNPDGPWTDVERQAW